MTAPYQTEAPALIRTSPTMSAVGATKALGWILGILSPIAKIGIHTHTELTI